MRFGLAGMVRCGIVRQGRGWLGSVWQARCVKERPVRSRWGALWLGMVRQVSCGAVCFVEVRWGMSRLVELRYGNH